MAGAQPISPAFLWEMHENTIHEPRATFLGGLGARVSVYPVVGGRVWCGVPGQVRGGERHLWAGAASIQAKSGIETARSPSTRWLTINLGKITKDAAPRKHRR